jgi:hypothetical protein
LDFFKNIENSLYLRTEDWVKLKSNILLWKYWYRGSRPKVINEPLYFYNYNKHNYYYLFLIYKFFINIDIESLFNYYYVHDAQKLFNCINRANLSNFFKCFANKNTQI